MKVPRLIVIMGPAGSGKTTLGRLLARELGWDFHDADDYHDPVNIERMRRGEPLSDADRQPWLARLRELLQAAWQQGRPTVLACSALRRIYREALWPEGVPAGGLHFVYLEVRPETLALRLVQRQHHFLTGTLLESQLATLEKPLAEDRDTLWLDGEWPVLQLVGRIRDELSI